MVTSEDPIALVRSESLRLVQYFESLTPADLTRQSACAAWNNADVIAHLSMGADNYYGNIERGVRGDSLAPEGSMPAGEEDLETRMESNAQRMIAHRENLGTRLVATFSSQCERLDQLLAGLGPKDLDKSCYHPLAIMPVSNYLDLRLTELTVHEWDIRSVLEPPGRLSEKVLPNNINLLPVFIVGRFYNPGSSIATLTRFRFSLTGTVSGSYDIVVGEGAARMEQTGPEQAAVIFSCDAEMLVLLAYGRISLDQALNSGRLTAEGDQELLAKYSD